MTRWRIALFIKWKLFISTEFNGDMYPEWHWDNVFKRLSAIKNETEFKEFIAEFNEENFSYGEKLVYEIRTSTKWFEEYFNLVDEEKYFEHRFSDWIFVKNLSWQMLQFQVDADDDTVLDLEDWETVRFNFWAIAEEDKDMFYIVK